VSSLVQRFINHEFNKHQKATNAAIGRGVRSAHVDVAYHIDVSGPKEALRAAERAARREMRAALREAGEDTVLPVARARAWSVIDNRIVIRSSTRAAWLTTSGPAKYGRIAGLMEFGGTVRTIVRPRTAQALSTPAGPRAAVKRPRHYKPRGILQFAVRSRLGAYEDAVGDRIADRFTDEFNQHQRW
jgi:hypothetical protein